MKNLFSKKTALMFSMTLFFFTAQAQVLTWAKQMGGTDDDQSYSIIVDSSGNVYTTGCFRGTVDFDPSLGSYTLAAAGNSDIFLSKIDASGNFIWAKQMNGTGNEDGRSIAIDTHGNIYIAGAFDGTVDFDPSTATYTLTAIGSYDSFVCKLNALGDFIWTKQIGGTQFDIINAIALDSLGYIYATGYFSGTTDFDPGTNNFNFMSNGISDIFINKLDTSGSFIWAKQIGGANNDEASSITIDNFGNIYTTGFFSNTVDFDPGVGSYTLSSIGFNDIFVSKLNTSGNFVWAKQMGGTDFDNSQSIKVNVLGNVLTTGIFNGIADFDPGANSYTLNSSGSSDIFISTLDSSGNFLFAKQIGGANNDYGTSIYVDVSGNIYTTGYFEGTSDFDPSINTFPLISSGNYDIFICKLDMYGNFIFAKQMGGSDNDEGYCITVDFLDNIYTTGRFFGTADFDPDLSTYYLNSSGSSDIFVHKMSTNIAGFSENSFLENVLIYPNPANNYFIISSNENWSNENYKLINTFGQTVLSGKLENKSTFIDISSLTSSLYTLQIQGKQKKIYKLIKK